VPISHAHGDPAQLAEERRLLYVALSRAERVLHLSWAAQRARGDRTSARTASPYLGEVAAAIDPTVDTADPERTRQGVREARARLAELAEGELGPEDRPLYDALVDWRRDLARASSVPAYVVFDNKTLRALARARPSGPAELLAVSGIGPVKVERYGAAVLEIVERHGASPA
jgi:DNA helicase-2/ATP-dependent DNA helicase PcrA